MQYVVYCGESRHDGGPGSHFMAIGSLWVPRCRKPQLKEALRSLFREVGLHAEVKWNKVSAARLDAYERIVDFFFAHGPNPAPAMDRPSDPRISRQHPMLGSAESNGKSTAAEPFVHRLSATLCRVARTANERGLALFFGVPGNRENSLGLRQKREKGVGELRRPVISPAHGTRSHLRRHEAWRHCRLAPASLSFYPKAGGSCQQIARC